MYFVHIHFKFCDSATIFLNHLKCHAVDYYAKKVTITYHSLSLPIHLHYNILLCRNNLRTLTDIMNLRKLCDIFYNQRKITLKSNIYIAVSLQMAAGSNSSGRQNLLHSAKSTESTEAPAG